MAHVPYLFFFPIVFFLYFFYCFLFILVPAPDGVVFLRRSVPSLRLWLWSSSCCKLQSLVSCSRCYPSLFVFLILVPDRLAFLRRSVPSLHPKLCRSSCCRRSVLQPRLWGPSCCDHHAVAITILLQSQSWCVWLSLFFFYITTLIWNTTPSSPLLQLPHKNGPEERSCHQCSLKIWPSENIDQQATTTPYVHCFFFIISCCRA